MNKMHLSMMLFLCVSLAACISTTTSLKAPCNHYATFCGFKKNINVDHAE